MEPRFGLAELCQGQRQDKALSLGMGLAGPCCSDPGMEKVLIPPVLEPSQEHSLSGVCSECCESARELGWSFPAAGRGFLFHQEQLLLLLLLPVCS